ncbi:hypothetical protein GOV06_03885 [Candidatus Woesearchaeota archaeon]|nr:hypothetical protein [Candidatus Woesearchaeota archaeon]
MEARGSQLDIGKSELCVIVNAERIRKLGKRYDRADRRQANYSLLSESQQEFLLHQDISHDYRNGAEVDVLEIRMEGDNPFLDIRDFYWYLFNNSADKGKGHIERRLSLYEKLTGIKPERVLRDALGTSSLKREDDASFPIFLFTLKDGSKIQVMYGINKIRV